MRFRLYEDNRIKSNRSFFPNNTEETKPVNIDDNNDSDYNKFLLVAGRTKRFDMKDNKCYPMWFLALYDYYNHHELLAYSVAESDPDYSDMYDGHPWYWTGNCYSRHMYKYHTVSDLSQKVPEGIHTMEIAAYRVSTTKWLDEKQIKVMKRQFVDWCANYPPPEEASSEHMANFVQAALTYYFGPVWSFNSSSYREYTRLVDWEAHSNALKDGTYSSILEDYIPFASDAVLGRYTFCF